MKKVAIAVAILILSSNLMAQENKKKQNLPITEMSQIEKGANIDYSKKLIDLNSVTPINANEVNFLKEYTEADLQEIKTIDINKYDFIQNADSYFHSLSPKVIGLYSIEELWNIYVYDQKLKKQLAEIK